jgi:hypothetical protein
MGYYPKGPKIAMVIGRDTPGTKFSILPAEGRENPDRKRNSLSDFYT